MPRAIRPCACRPSPETRVARREIGSDAGGGARRSRPPGSPDVGDADEEVSAVRMERRHLRVGREELPYRLGFEDGEPRTVFIAYEHFLDLLAVLVVSRDTLQAVGASAEPSSDVGSSGRT